MAAMRSCKRGPPVATNGADCGAYGSGWGVEVRVIELAWCRLVDGHIVAWLCRQCVARANRLNSEHATWWGVELI